MRSDQLWMAVIVSARLIPGFCWRMKSTDARTSRARVDSKPDIKSMVALRLFCSCWSSVLTYLLISSLRSCCMVSGSNAVAFICSNPLM